MLYVIVNPTNGNIVRVSKGMLSYFKQERREKGLLLVTLKEGEEFSINGKSYKYSDLMKMI